MQGQEVAAYLMFGRGVNKPGLIEGGGSLEGLECLVRHVLQELEASRRTEPGEKGYLGLKPRGKVNRERIREEEDRHPRRPRLCG